MADSRAHSVSITDTSVWVTTWEANNLNVIDPATNTKTAEIHALSGPMSVTVAGGAAWVAGTGQLNSFIPA